MRITHYILYIIFKLEPSNTCSQKITNIMYERLEPTGFYWKEVSKETKDFYFDEFKVIYLLVYLFNFLFGKCNFFLGI